MEKKELFRESIRLVWVSAPGWATFNIILSVLRSFLPLALLFLIKILIDEITSAVSSDPGNPFSNIMLTIIAVVAIYFLDEATTDLGNFVRKKQSLSLEIYMYGLLHEKSVRLDLINFEQPGYYDSLARASGCALAHPDSRSPPLPSLDGGCGPCRCKYPGCMAASPLRGYPL